MAVSVPAAYQGWVSTAAAKTGLPAAVVAAQINEESGFNPKAVSPAGAQGIAQFEPGTWASNAPKGSSPFDPNASLVAYTNLMGSLLHQYGGNVKNALAAYNAGPGNLGAGMGYANTILSNAGGGTSLKVGGSAGSLPTLPTGGSTTVSIPGFNQAGFDAARARYIAGTAVNASSGTSNPYNTSPGATKGFASSIGGNGAAANPLFTKGLLTTTAPNESDFATTQTLTVAQNEIQKLAGDTPLATPQESSAAADKILNMARSALGGPYNQATHATAFTESAAQIKQTGTDCSGFVSWLMGPDGLGIWKQALATPDIQNAPGIQSGAGKSITIYNNPLPGNSGHVFIEIDGQFFQSAGGGAGIQSISSADAQQMIRNGDNGAPYSALHPKGY